MVIAATDSRTSAPTPSPLVEVPAGAAAAPRWSLLYHSFAYFLSELRDDKDAPLIVAEHHEEWADLFQHEALLCLLAPRDHGKTWTSIGYLLWRAWRHNRDPETGLLKPDLPDGAFEAVIFSETITQAGQFFELFQSLLLGNPDLFSDLTPDFSRGTKAQLRDVWSRRRLRLGNRFECSIRAYRTSTRGLHPDLIVCDDVLSEKNSLTAYQRNKVWNYFVGTLLPMNAKQVIIVGTAQHYDDLLHRLKPDPKKPMLTVGNRLARFHWAKYRAVNWDTGDVLWEGRHNLVDLTAKRDFEPVIFAREYQNDPRDDASSLFPFPLTQKALEQGAEWTFETGVVKAAGQFVVLGMDLAMSEATGADYTVCQVYLYDRPNQKRRLLWASRERGLSFVAQVDLLRFACSRFGVDLGVVEDNGYQKWVHTETMKYPETAGRLVGHRTGREKASLTEGVPSLKLGLLQGMWVLPSGDEESRAFAHEWQSELNAFGWKDDKLQGVGEHDDVVMSWWFCDLAVRLIEEWLGRQPTEEVVYADDVGIDSRVTISGDY